MDGKELKELRNRLGLTQIQMAEKLYISRSALWKLEQGIRNMSRPVAAHADKLKNHADQDEFLASQGLQ